MKLSKEGKDCGRRYINVAYAERKHVLLEKLNAEEERTLLRRLVRLVNTAVTVRTVVDKNTNIIVYDFQRLRWQHCLRSSGGGGGGSAITAVYINISLIVMRQYTFQHDENFCTVFWRCSLNWHWLPSKLFSSISRKSHRAREYRIFGRKMSWNDYLTE